MKTYILILLFLITATFQVEGLNWPLEIKTASGAVVTIYQPQPESMQGNKIIGRTAFSAKEMAGNDLVFGVFWYTAFLLTDRDARTAKLDRITVTQVKLPGIEDENKINKLIALLESEIPKQEIIVSLDEIAATLEQEQQASNAGFKNEAPPIIFKSMPTVLVIIDGEPKLQQDDKLKMKRVINSAFLIVENPDDHKFYLFDGNFWFVSAVAAKDYVPATQLPKSISALDKELKKQQKESKAEKPASPPALIISTTPTELIQSKGEAQYANIQGTTLLYMSNSDNDIFKNIADQKFYVLISGRWYTAAVLEGPWTFIQAEKLPPDFAQIPEGSTKDNVLASVPGTKASRDAITDAQIPQTAKVDRKTATCTVKYDGEPKFESIEGTTLQRAVNTSSTVMKSGSKYYCVETGVWFVADNAKGPWKVSDSRPSDVEKIPASSPAYNTQYVYIYDSTPDVVYVGYTPGYMGCYVYGGTVIYGTGYYYNPWYGPYYYPYPMTYGYGMAYSPYCGWSVSVHYGYGGYYGGGGYWGPPMYRPPYYPPYHGGMYGGGGPVFINNGDINIDRSNNMYNNRKDVSTRDVPRGNTGQNPSTRDVNRNSNAGQNSKAGVSQQPATGTSRNNVYGDKNGNVYQRNDNGNWNQRDGNQWKDTNQSSNMNRDYDNRQRSTNQNNNFQQSNRGGNMGGSMGGGGNRGGGGGGGRRR